jgi:hypothetical protein
MFYATGFFIKFIRILNAVIPLGVRLSLSKSALHEGKPVPIKGQSIKRQFLIKRVWRVLPE